jgi:hypothetical protein
MKLVARLVSLIITSVAPVCAFAGPPTTQPSLTIYTTGTTYDKTVTPDFPILVEIDLGASLPFAGRRISVEWTGHAPGDSFNRIVNHGFPRGTNRLLLGLDVFGEDGRLIVLGQEGPDATQSCILAAGNTFRKFFTGPLRLLYGKSFRLQAALIIDGALVAASNAIDVSVKGKIDSFPLLSTQP